MRDGLERIDRDGGSSLLNVVVRDAAGGRVDSDAVYRKMSVFQQALEVKLTAQERVAYALALDMES